MLVIDDREHGLESELKLQGVPFSIQRMEYGDCVFEGRGPDNKLVTIGCERKRLSDLITSMTDRRLSGRQLKGMIENYDFVYLFVEAVWRPTAGDEIEHLPYGQKQFRPLFTPGRNGRTISYRQLNAYLSTLELKASVIVRRTSNARETISQWAALWHWFNDKRWEQHTSHDQTYVPAPGRNLRGGKVGFSTGVQMSTLYKMAAQLPGISHTRAEAVAKHFGSVKRMVAAGPSEWQKIDGIGKLTAERAVKEIQGNDAPDRV